MPQVPLTTFYIFAEGISEFETLEKYFARLEQKHKWTDLGKGKDVLWSLRSMKISTVKALKEIWAGAKKKLPLSIGIKTVLEDEMKKIPMVIGSTNIIFLAIANTVLKHIKHVRTNNATPAECNERITFDITNHASDSITW